MSDQMQEGQMKCMNPQCGSAFQIAPPRPIVSNQVEYSSIMLIHEAPIICPNCSQHYAFQIMNYRLGVVPITPQQAEQPQKPGNGESSRIIIPPAGARIRKQ